MSGSPLIDIGKLSEPATKLIEKIADAVEGACRPWQIRRLAHAEADAAEITAISQINLSELQRRAAYRFIAEETKKQINMETITAKALPGLEPDAKPQDMEDDWIANFFDKCRLISDEKMQDLWAKLLAGEANSPGKYSKRTVGILAAMDKRDAVLFSNLRSFAWASEGSLHPLIYDHNDLIYNGKEINFGTLTHMDSIGLISFDANTGFTCGMNREEVLTYYGESVKLLFPNAADIRMDIGRVILSNVGHDLMRIGASNPCPGFKDYSIQQWRSLGYEILS